MKKLLLLIIALSFLLGTFVKAQTTAENDYYNRLYYLCKVWGYLKYFHSEVAKGTQEWDDVLLTKIDEVKNADSDSSFNQILSDLIELPGTTEIPTVDPPIINEDLSYNLDLAWFDDPMLSAEVKNSLNDIREKFRPRSNHYVSQAFTNGNPTFDNDNRYYSGWALYPDERIRLLGLFRYWNIINYFFPYKNLMDQDWGITLTEFIPEFINAQDKTEYNYAFLKLATRINDTHAFTSSSAISDIIGTYYIPLEVRLIENQTIVTNNFTGDRDIKNGDVIKSINGVEVNKIRDSLSVIAAASNQSAKDRLISNDLVNGPFQDHEDEIVLEDDSGEKEFALERIYVSFYYDHLTSNISPIWKIINSGNNVFGYVDMGRLQVDQIERMFDDLWDTDGIIFDIRNYPNGTLWYMINYLFDAPITIAKFTTPDITYPGLLYWNPATIGFGDFSKTYDKNIYILFDERTQSQAEYTIMGLEQHPKAIKIGSQTAGADGNVSRVYLPGTIITMFTGLGTFYPDGRETQRIGIVPDIEVRPTIKGIREGRDEVLETVFDIVTDVEENETANSMADFALSCYPNPFNSETNINVSIEKEGRISLIIYDILGRKVKTIFDSQLQPGTNRFLWNGLNDNNIEVSGGVYLVTLRTGDEFSVAKLLLIK